MKKNKVLIIGIDGGTFDIIRPLIEQGELPNIASLMRDGVSSDLQSTTPPITAPAWLSFMTGKNPGKHGVFHFIGDTHKNYSGRVMNTADLKAKTIWSILSENQKKLVLLNVPLTYPPEKLNGIVIPGMGTPPNAHVFTHPEDIFIELKKEIGDYMIDCSVDNVFNNDGTPNHLFDPLLEQLKLMMSKRTEAALYLMRKYDWDLFMVVYVITDRLQHLCWKFMDPTHPDHNPETAKHLQEAIFNGYRTVDTAIGRLLSEAGDNVTVVIMSDHGFGHLQKCFLVNKWLKQQNLLKVKRILPWKFIFTHPSLLQILSKLKIKFIARVLPSFILDLSIPRLRITQKNWVDLIDWKKTKAYASDPLGISINLKGREKYGIVSPGEDYENLLKHITDDLMKIKDNENELVTDGVDRKEHLYTGQYLKFAPDLLFSMKGLSILSLPFKIYSKDLFISPINQWSGTHRPNGIFIMKGPDVLKSVTLDKSQIIDVAPTILALFDQPIPEDMDGTVLMNCFKPGSLNLQKTTGQTTKNESPEPQEKVLTEDDEEKVRKHLKDLGYLS